MEDFLNNPIAVGMLTFGLLLIVGSKTILWQRRKEQQLSLRPANVDHRDLGD